MAFELSQLGKMDIEIKEGWRIRQPFLLSDKSAELMRGSFVRACSTQKSLEKPRFFSETSLFSLS
jgi:hypothetical protein